MESSFLARLWKHLSSRSLEVNLEVLHKKEDSLLSLLQRGYICTDLVVHSSANGSMSIPPFPKGPSQSPIRLLNLPTRSSEGGSTQYPQVGGRSTHCMEAWADKVKDAWNLDIIIKSFFIETWILVCPIKLHCLRTYIMKWLMAQTILSVSGQEMG